MLQKRNEFASSKRTGKDSHVDFLKGIAHHRNQHVQHHNYSSGNVRPEQRVPAKWVFRLCVFPWLCFQQTPNHRDQVGQFLSIILMVPHTIWSPKKPHATEHGQQENLSETYPIISVRGK